MSAFKDLKAKYIYQPDSIRVRVAEWAFEEADDLQEVIERLESMDCAGCYSPAPVYYHDMAAEIAAYWPEIDDAIDSYREATGETWVPAKNQNFLTYLWFAYEWAAHELASEISLEYEQMRQQEEQPVILETPAEMTRLPTPAEIIANPAAWLPDAIASNDNDLEPER